MATATIEIDGTPGSDTDLELGNTITFSNQDNTGVSTWLWTLEDKPASSAAALATPAASTTDLTPDVEGTYLVSLSINAGADDDQVVAAVRTLRARLRIPSAGERVEEDSSRGWAISRNRDLAALNRLVQAGSVQIGLVPSGETPPDGASWKRGNVVAASTITDIDPSGGTLSVPVWRKPATIVGAGEFIQLIGVVMEDTDGNTSFDQAVSNVPGVTGRVVNVCVEGFVDGISGALDFTDATIFPEGVNVGDPLWLDTGTAAHELTNVNDYFGTALLAGGSFNDFEAFDERSHFIGYVVDNGNPGAVFVTRNLAWITRTSPFRVDNGIIAHSLRLGHSTSPEGNYGGLKIANTVAGCIECEGYDISHGSSASMTQFDIVSFRDTDTGDPNARTEMLSAHLADASDDTTWSFLGMITNVGASPDAGRSLKATVFGVVRGCGSAFPGGTTNGEVLYLSNTTPGELVRLSSLSDTDEKIAVGRVYSTTVQGGIFFVGPDSNLRKDIDHWEDTGAYLYPKAGASKGILQGATTPTSSEDVQLLGAGVLIETTDDVSITPASEAAGAGLKGHSVYIYGGEGSEGDGVTGAGVGGEIEVRSGFGGDAAGAAADGAAAGALQLLGGIGGDGSTSGTQTAGGAGGNVVVDAGTGGVGGSVGGTGDDGGDGGTVTITGGAGGDAGHLNADGGAGGIVTVQGGAGGAGSGGSGNDGADGKVVIGDANTLEVELGAASSIDTTVKGDFNTEQAQFVNRTAHGISGNITASEYIAACTAAGITLTLTTAITEAGRVVIVNDESGGAQSSPITVDTQAGELIDGAASQQITTNYGTLRLYSDGTDWFTF